MTNLEEKPPIASRFRGFLPVVIDVETAGFNAKRDALLEIAAVTLEIDDAGTIRRKETIACHVEPFPGANLDQESLEFTGIDPYHPFRMAKPEHDALEHIFKPVRRAIKDSHHMCELCQDKYLVRYKVHGIYIASRCDC